MVTWLQETGERYQGQFGEFTVTTQDRLGVVLYRAALTTAAIAVGLATVIALGLDNPLSFEPLLNLLLAVFCLSLGVCLWTIHIYLKPLHITLQILWGLGCIATCTIALTHPQGLWTALYRPLAWELVGTGLIFVALTGLFVKEAFCFNRWQAKTLIVLVPSLLLGHWLGLLTPSMEQGLLATWAFTFLWFVLDKDTQPIPPDVGDKTVFEYLRQGRMPQAN